MGNTLRTTFLLGLLTALIVWVGKLFGGQNGMMIALIFAAAMNLGSYWFSDKIVLAMYRAQPLDESQNPQLYSMVRDLTVQAGLPMPRLFVIPNDTPNAFATGRNPEHAVVAVTDGLLRLLNREEIRGVLAHELSHVKNRDILIGSIAATLAGVIMMLANMAKWAAIFGGVRGGDEGDSRGGGVIAFLITVIVAPIAAMLIQMAISRSREYLADETGARLTHQPEGLAHALEKLAIASERLPMVDAKPSTAHMFIVNPLTGKSIMSLFSTHPPIEERIARLRAMTF